MSHAGEATVQSDNDFFVVRQRIAEEQARVRAENLSRVVRNSANPAVDVGRPGRMRAWLGRRLVGIGTVLAGDPPVSEPGSTTGQPC